MPLELCLLQIRGKLLALPVRTKSCKGGSVISSGRQNKEKGMGKDALDTNYGFTWVWWVSKIN